MFEISFQPADGSGKLTTEVFEFTGTGGVTMGMYNTDEVCVKSFSMFAFTVKIGQLFGEWTLGINNL